MIWLADHLMGLTLAEDHEGYFLGRGAKEDTIQRLGVKTWKSMASPCPDETFRRRYGTLGEQLEDWVLWPLRSPRGRVIGFSGRRGTEKDITRYLLPEAAWQPVWTGLDMDVMERIWAGGDVWIVEGIFDLFPLEWAVPAEDVVLGSERAHLTRKHVEFLRRYARQTAQQVKVVYDNDETGRRGVHDWVDDQGKTRWGALHRLQRVGVDAVDVKYRGKDPGEVWNRGGAAAVQAAFRDA